MKTMSLLILIAFLLIACDAPQRVRTQDGSYGNNVNSNNNGSDGSFGTTTGSSTGGGSTTGGTGGQTINCNLIVTATHPGLGSVEVCQDSVNELFFRLTFSTTDQTDGTCVVPMYRDNSGSSTYLGNAQCTQHNQGQVVFGQVTKNRSGYTSYPINSVMVLKYSGTNAFFQCMNAYGTNYSTCMSAHYNNPAYQNYCQTQATNYMTTVCNAFRATYPYSQVTTR